MHSRRYIILTGGLMLLAVLASAFVLNRSDAAANLAFRNALNPPPATWQGPTFTLSDDYPDAQPAACSAADCPWLGIGGADVFDTHFGQAPPSWSDTVWDDYIMSILDYVRQRQDPMLRNDVGFQTAPPNGPNWYHVPWMAYDETSGREFVHGTTNERTAHLSDLLGNDHGFGVNDLPNEQCSNADFPHGFETWAVGVYNAHGGWSLGQAWPETGTPRIGEYLGTAVPAGLPFPEGTVVAKFLFTNAPASCVSYLRGAPEWQVNRHKQNADGTYSCEREVQTVRLVQVDVAVVDERSPIRWVYGTFGYNANLGADNAWDNLAPVGLQWGSDPWTFPAVPQTSSQPAQQSVLNTDIGIYEHFGCNGRLAGPVDNAKSSCVSCHASAFAAPNGAVSQMGTNAPPSFGFDGLCDQYSQENVSYFQNAVIPQSYHGGLYPNALNLDTSLQMAVAFDQYGQFNTYGEPRRCTDPTQF